MIQLCKINEVSDNYFKWMQDSDLLKFTEARHLKHTRESLGEYIKTVNADPNSFLYGIFKDDEHIGNIKIGPVKNGYGSVGIIISGQYQGYGYGRSAIEKAITLHNISLTAGCYAANIPAINLFATAGFKYVGLKKKFETDVLMFIRV